MANTVAGVNLTRISQLTLDSLVTEGIPLDAFTTDFDSEVLPHGEAVTTRFVTNPTTQDFAVSKAPSDSAMTARTVTLDNYRGVSIGFDDMEITLSDVDLLEMYVRPSIAAIVDYVLNATLEEVTQAAGFAAGVTSVAANFDADDVADLAQQLSTGKVPKFNRNLILPPTYTASLMKDGVIQDASSYASDEPIKDHVIPRLHGFNILEYNGTIPANGGDNMVGIATAQQGVIIAARGVTTPPPGTWYGSIENVVDPRSGLPIQIREHYDGNKLNYQFSVLFGTEIGVTANTLQIVSA